MLLKSVSTGYYMLQERDITCFSSLHSMLFSRVPWDFNIVTVRLFVFISLSVVVLHVTDSSVVNREHDRHAGG